MNIGNFFVKLGVGANTKKPAYIKVYKTIKNQIQFQRNFSSFLLVTFFVLQYSVPIFLVILGSIASSREQLATFLPSDSLSNLNNSNNSNNSNHSNSIPDKRITRIIYLVGLITILLGVINNIVRPSESYDIAAKYSNKFFNFEQTLELELLKAEILNSSEDEKANRENFKIILDLLSKKNNELCQLIDEYNEARSLSLHINNLKALNQDKNKNDNQIPPS